MNYKALAFFDLDGTLLDEHSQITPEISEAMHRLRQNDVLPIIATGRTETEIMATNFHIITRMVTGQLDTMMR